MAERRRLENLLILAMVIGTAAVSASSGILTLFTVDMASTFNVSVGIASQLATINYFGEFVFSLLMGILAVRFRYKSLLIAGVLFVSVSTIGNFLAPEFATMQIFFAMEGVGTVIFGVMSLTLFGDVFPPKKRAKAVSYVTTALWVTALINFPLSGFIASAIGWRYNFILNILPVSLAGLILSLFVIPSKQHAPTAPAKKVNYVESFKQVFTDKSATACLAGSILSTAGAQIGIFGVAFYRQRFSVSMDWIVLLNMVAIIVFAIGSLVAGRLTNKLGAKRLAVTSTLLNGVFTMTFFLIPNIWGALFFDFLHMWFAALAAPSYLCLALAQVPKSRGTMMSLNSATGALARTIAPAIGGALLVFTTGFYGAVGLALGGMSVAAAAILFSLATDPTRTQLEDPDMISKKS